VSTLILSVLHIKIYLTLVAFLFYFSHGHSQDTLEISPKIGKIIDKYEKMNAGILPYYSNNTFISGFFTIDSNQIITLTAILVNDSIVHRIISIKEYEWIQSLLDFNYPQKFLLENGNNRLLPNHNPDTLFIQSKISKPKNPKKYNVFSIGIGGSNIGFVFGGTYSLLDKSSVLTFRYTTQTEISFGILSRPSEPKIFANEFGFLYGLKTNDGKISGMASIGLGFSSGNQRGKLISSSGGFFGTDFYEELLYNTFSIPFELQLLFLSKSSNAGIGFNVFGNVNSKNSIFGYLVSFSVAF
jgi:hypothetical protein